MIAAADFRCALSEHTVCGTFPTLVFGHVADAAFVCSRSGVLFAVQWTLPKQPFKFAFRQQSQTVF